MDFQIKQGTQQKCPKCGNRLLKMRQGGKAVTKCSCGYLRLDYAKAQVTPDQTMVR